MKTKTNYSKVKELIRQEVESSFTVEELLSYHSFEAFYADVCVQNAYEENWHDGLYKSVYKTVFNDLIKGRE